MGLPNLTDIDALYALNDKLRDELAQERANADRRARDAYQGGLKEGRKYWWFALSVYTAAGAIAALVIVMILR